MPQKPYNGKEFMTNVCAYPWPTDTIRRKATHLAYFLRDQADYRTGLPWRASVKDASPTVRTIARFTGLRPAMIAEGKQHLVEAGFLRVDRDGRHDEYTLISSPARGTSPGFSNKELAAMAPEGLAAIRKRVDFALESGIKANAIRQAAQECHGQHIWDVLARAKELQDRQNVQAKQARHEAVQAKRRRETEALIAEDAAKSDEDREVERAKRHATPGYQELMG